MSLAVPKAPPIRNEVIFRSCGRSPTCVLPRTGEFLSKATDWLLLYIAAGPPE